MTVFNEIAMCMSRPIISAYYVFQFFYKARHMTCVWSVSAFFKEVAILAAFNVLIISSTKLSHNLLMVFFFSFTATKCVSVGSC